MRDTTNRGRTGDEETEGHGIRFGFPKGPTDGDRVGGPLGIVAPFAALAVVALVGAGLLLAGLPAAAQDVIKKPTTSSAPAVVEGTSTPAKGTPDSSASSSPDSSGSGDRATTMSAAGTIEVSGDDPGSGPKSAAPAPTKKKKEKVPVGTPDEPAASPTAAGEMTGGSAPAGYLETTYEATTYSASASASAPAYRTPYTGGVSTTALGVLGAAATAVLGTAVLLAKFAFARGSAPGPAGEGPYDASGDGTGRGPS